MNNSYDKENLSTKQSSPREKARLSRPDGDQKRSRRIKTPSCQRTQGINGQTLLKFTLPKDSRLQKRREFLQVYAEGKRFEARLMTVFILPAKKDRHQLGITSSKKAIGNAFERNRSKRLLRESFRLSRVELDGLSGKYDWVINARRGLLRVKLEKALQEFRQIVEAVKKSESKMKLGEQSVAVEAQKR